MGLEPVPGTEGHRLLEVLKVPFTYCWSPSLVPKPFDWGSHIGQQPLKGNLPGRQDRADLER